MGLEPLQLRARRLLEGLRWGCLGTQHVAGPKAPEASAESVTPGGGAPRHPHRSPSRPALLRVFEPLIDPGHHVPQVAADVLDLVPRTLGPHPIEVLVAGAVLGDELAGEVARLDLGED